VNAIADRAFLIEQRVVTLPLTSAHVCLADVTRHGAVTVIRSGQRSEPDLILQGPDSAAIRMLGRVL
jgi:hypothetical protein